MLEAPRDKEVPEAAEPWGSFDVLLIASSVAVGGSLLALMMALKQSF